MDGAYEPTSDATARVLVVDDSTTVRRLVSRLLSRAGFVVTEAVDGLDAIARCAVERPDIVVLDLEMPGCSGLAALQQIKSDRDLAETEVIMLTSRASPADARAALTAGASDYVRKPCDPGELVERVRRAARARVARRELQARSAIDELTGLPNRRGMQGLLSALSMPSSALIGVLMVDIDRFKRINDAWGHPVGDTVLKVVAGRLARAWPLFTVARWGGEEFFAAGPVHDLQELEQIAERVRATVAATTVEAGEDIPALVVTVSVGGAIVERGADENATIAVADQALYEAKAAGRDRVVIMPVRVTTLEPT